MMALQPEATVLRAFPVPVVHSSAQHNGEALTLHLSMVSRHLPEPEGTAPGRALLAVVEGLAAEGHGVDVWSWRPEHPEAELPGWCTWRPLDYEPRLAMKLRALRHPRADVTRAKWWRPREGALVVADDPESFAAVWGYERNVLVQHYSAPLDARALGWQARDLQSVRAERRNARRASVLLAYSQRVADQVGRTAKTAPTAVPIAYTMPPTTIEPVDAPTAVLIADWRWPPNHLALRDLLTAWPDVTRSVPGAKLILAGRGLDPSMVGALSHVQVLGEIARVSDVLDQAAVIAFPCPATSGPKVKVLEGLAYGIPVVTTDAGAEGIQGSGGIVASSGPDYGRVLAQVLANPERRAAMSVAGATAVRANHSPEAAARARIAAITAGLDALDRAGS